MEAIKIVKFAESMEIEKMEEKEKKEEKIKDEENECSICLENIEESSKKIVRCGHIFHGECIGKWLEGHDKCPLCIQTIVEVEEKNKDIIQTVNTRINIFGVIFCIIMIFTVISFIIFEIVQKI
jgi:hypothetical protein